MLILLQNKGRMTAQELSERLEVSERTVYRDLDALSVAGIPVYAERGPGGGCALLENYRTNLTGLNEDELRALFMVSVPEPLADLGMGKALEAAQLKLSAAVSTARQSDIEHVKQRIHLDSAAWFHPAEPTPFLETIQDAVWHDRCIRIDYRRMDGQWVNRFVDPLGLVAKASTWYMVGRTRTGTYVFRISRIQSVDMVGSSFEHPADFDLAQFWISWVTRFEDSRARVEVSIRLSPTAIPMLLRILGESLQQTVDAAQPDDRGWIYLPLTFQSLDEAQMYLSGFGDAVEVMEPADLRQRIINTATQTLTHYVRRNP